MTTFTVPRTARPISEDMFADWGVPHVTFTPTPDGGQQVDVPIDVSAQDVLRAKIRLLTANPADEALLESALDALTANTAYLASTPTTAQALAQVKALTAQVNGLLEWVGRDALGGSL